MRLNLLTNSAREKVPSSGFIFKRAFLLLAGFFLLHSLTPHLAFSKCAAGPGAPQFIYKADPLAKNLGADTGQGGCQPLTKAQRTRHEEITAAKEVAAKDKIAMLQLDLTEQINNDWLEYSTLDSEVESLQFSYNASIDVIDSYIRQFRISKKSWLDVMNAQREKTQNFYQLTEAQMEKMKVTFRIMLNTGMLTASTLDVNNQ